MTLSRPGLVIVGLLSALGSTAVAAQFEPHAGKTMTAICTDLHGKRVDKDPRLNGGQPEFVDDGFLGMTYSFSWRVGAREVTLIKGGGLNRSSSQMGIANLEDSIFPNDFVSFRMETLPMHTAVWSILPKQRAGLFTWQGHEGASGLMAQMMIASCDVTFR